MLSFKSFFFDPVSTTRTTFFKGRGWSRIKYLYVNRITYNCTEFQIHESDRLGYGSLSQIQILPFINIDYIILYQTKKNTTYCTSV